MAQKQDVLPRSPLQEDHVPGCESRPFPNHCAETNFRNASDFGLGGLAIQSTKQVHFGVVTVTMLSCPGWLTWTVVSSHCMSHQDLEATIQPDHLSKITTSQLGIAKEHSGKSCKPLLRPFPSPLQPGAELWCFSSDLPFCLIHFKLPMVHLWPETSKHFLWKLWS